MKMEVELPDVKKRAIQELGYGTNAKVLVGFKSRVWEKQGYSGATYSDELFQLAWANSFLQPGPAAVSHSIRAESLDWKPVRERLKKPCSG